MRSAASLSRRAARLVAPFAVRAVRRVPVRVRRLMPEQARQRFLGSGRPGRRPMVSVVIPVYNVEQYLAECLDSVLAQTLRDLEILVVDDGSTDGSPQIIESYASAHPRIRAFRQDNAGQGAARNLGVAHSRGRFLTFLDADDTLPEDAYQKMSGTLRKSGSDFCVGSVRRVSNGRQTPAPWPAAVHLRDRIGITIDDFPDAMQDVIACNRMLRREFWLEQVGGFRGGIAYEDHVPMVAAYLRATRFDVLRSVTYWWRIRENQTSTGQQKHVLRNLLDRIEVKAEAREIVQREASPSIYAAWVGRVLNTDFPPFVNQALRNDDAYREVLQAAYRTYLDIATPEALAHVRVQQKLRGWLVSRGLWEQLELLQKFFQDNGTVLPTTILDGRLYATLAVRDRLDPAIGQEMFELGALESAFVGCLQRAVWVDEQTLELTGWTYITGVDLAGTTPHVQAALVELTSGQRVALPLEQLVLPDATQWSSSRYANYDSGGFRCRLDVAELLSAGATAGTQWQLVLSVAARGLARQGSVHYAAAGGSAAGHALLAQRLADRPVKAVPRFDPSSGFSLSLWAVGVELDEMAAGDGRAVGGRLTWYDDVLGSPASLRATDRLAKTVVTSPVLAAEHAGGRHTCRFSLSLPVVLDDSGLPVATSWEIRLVDRSGGTKLVNWPALEPDAALGDGGPARSAWRRSPHGYAKVVTDSPLLRVTSATTSDDLLELRVDYGGLGAAELATATLSSTRTEVPARRVDHPAPGVVVLEFSLRDAPFGGPNLPLPTGGYAMTVVDGQGTRHAAALAVQLLGEVPALTETATGNVRLSVVKPAEFRLVVLPALSADERGNWAQHRLRVWYQEADLAPEDSVLFQCYRGEVATDSQRALHEELVRRGSDLTLYWGVESHATWVPDGGVKLVIGSRQWYEKLARSRFLCSNVDFDGFFRKRPHQRYLQTFHGYPFKSMGRSFWSGKGFTPERVELELARRNAEWDAILVPSEPCEQMYRAEYDYTGEILTTGYPRCDALVQPTPQRREQVLLRLGVDPSKTVIIYAPTFRDSLTTANFAAKRFEGLDLAELSACLDDSYVLLLRGHNNNQREPDRVRGHARVLDVTDYPEINDLTVAADAAVLDYSSLRFDWALTGKPMVFFVPDMADYFAWRPPLFAFEDSAPGPLLTTTADVGRALRDLPGLRARYGDALSSFNTSYNALHDGKATERVVDSFFLQPGA